MNLVKRCDECKLHHCKGCEYTWNDLHETVYGLQKDNEKLREINHDQFSKIIRLESQRKQYIHRDKIKCMIFENKEKIKENNNEIEKCRKTIMEEQELKKLKLYTLHKNNDLLELEIADLLELLKEE